MAKKPAGLADQPDANMALNPLVGLAREDLVGAVSVMLRETAGKPLKTLKHMQAFAGDVVRIVRNESDLAPDARDRRFADAAWRTNPFYRAGMQYYLAVQKGIAGWVEEMEVDELERARARFVSGMIIDSIAPTNTLAGNPSALKKAIETGGGSLIRGLKNAYNDMVNNDGIVSQVDSRPFKLGENIALSKGAVVYRSEIMELIQYAPTTATVHAIPQLTIPPQINKAYINDLSPEKSVIKFLCDNGVQPFLISWRNPTKKHRDWGLAAYVDAIIDAIGVICEITGSDKVNVVGACSGGITMATLLSKMAASKDARIGAATMMVCVLEPQITDSEAGALVSENGIRLARQRSAQKGILDGASLTRTFAWLRPNDLIWNYVVNNYLHGEDPPAFDILHWNNDATNLTAALHSDYLEVYEKQPFARPGTAAFADHLVDLTKVTNDLFILAGVTDHITPWKACYRSTQLFGSKHIEFVLSHSGHIQAILNPPGNPKAKFYRNPKKPPADVDAWMAGAEEKAGSWWPYWIAWLKKRSGKEIAAPTVLGSAAHPAGDPAPGRYVFN
jgi:polyhydroxyalkanoate synthase